MGITVTETLNHEARSKLGPTLLLLRHGQIAANKDGVWHGSTDSKLTWLGRRQAKLTSRLLANKQQRIDAVFASPLQRCQHTATLATRHLKLDIQSHAGLAEMSIGDWEALPFDTLHHEHDMYTKMRDDQRFTPPNGESLSTVSERTANAFIEISAGGEPGQVILIVSHGVAMAIALATLLDHNPAKWQEYVVGNCALSELTLTPEPCLFTHNQANHI